MTFQSLDLKNLGHKHFPGTYLKGREKGVTLRGSYLAESVFLHKLPVVPAGAGDVDTGLGWLQLKGNLPCAWSVPLVPEGGSITY